MSKQQPHDDELDELLDDALEQFTTITPKKKSKKSSKSKKESSKSSESTDKVLPATKVAAGSDKLNEDILGSDFESEFAKQLAKGMEDLLKGGGGGLEALGLGGSGDSGESDGQMKEALDQLLKQMSSLQTDLNVDPTAPSELATSSNSRETATAMPAQGGSNDQSLSFQDKIKATMDKLKESSDKVEAESSSQLGGFPGMDMMDDLMKQMEGLGDDGQLDSLVDDVIGQLMSKDMLYQPLKDLDVEYPKYLEKNKDSISKEDYDRYCKQHEYIKEIIRAFDESSGDEKNDSKIVDLMQKMQDCGQPPAELLKILAPDADIGANGEIKTPEAPNCSIM